MMAGEPLKNSEVPRHKDVLPLSTTDMLLKVKINQNRILIYFCSDPSWMNYSDLPWIVDGCYPDLLQIAEIYATDIIFMNLDIARYIKNAKKPPLRTAQVCKQTGAS